MKLVYAVMIALLLTLSESQAMDDRETAKSLGGTYTCVGSCSGNARIVYQSGTNVICIDEKNTQSSGSVNGWHLACFNGGQIAEDKASVVWNAAQGGIPDYQKKGNIWTRDGCSCPGK
jgi:hypothetical protein